MLSRDSRFRGSLTRYSNSKDNKIASIRSTQCAKVPEAPLGCVQDSHRSMLCMWGDGASCSLVSEKVTTAGVPVAAVPPEA